MKKIFGVLLALLVAVMPLFGVSAEGEKEKMGREAILDRDGGI